MGQTPNPNGDCLGSPEDSVETFFKRFDAPKKQTTCAMASLGRSPSPSLGQTATEWWEWDGNDLKACPFAYRCRGACFETLHLWYLPLVCSVLLLLLLPRLLLLWLLLLWVPARSRELVVVRRTEMISSQ